MPDPNQRERLKVAVPATLNSISNLAEKIPLRSLHQQKPPLKLNVSNMREIIDEIPLNISMHPALNNNNSL